MKKHTILLILLAARNLVVLALIVTMIFSFAREARAFSLFNALGMNSLVTLATGGYHCYQTNECRGFVTTGGNICQSLLVKKAHGQSLTEDEQDIWDAFGCDGL